MISLSEILPRLRTGSLSLAESVRAAMARVERDEPTLQALLPEPGREHRLLTEAAALEQRFPEPALRPPLFGALVGIKDIYHVAGHPTRAGSTLPPEMLAGEEAVLVSRLRAAGALVLGKTTTTEFAYFEPAPTRNPRNPEHTPGGSSSGSAAAVAAGYCPFALGTQTVGSVIRPAAYCGVVGFKPSHGALALQGVIPYAPSLDHAGVFVSSARDLPAALQPLGLAVRCDSPLRRVLAVVDGSCIAGADAAARRAFQAAVSRLEEAGWRLVCCEPWDQQALQQLWECNQHLASVEMAVTHREWYADYRDRYRPRTVAQIEAGQAVTPEQLFRARRHQAAERERLQALLDALGADAWLMPAATGEAPAGLDSTGDPVMNLPWSFAGLPAATLPCGTGPGGLPLGLQVAGRFSADAALLRLLEELEPVVTAGADAAPWSTSP